MVFTPKQPQEAGLRPRVTAPLLALAVLVGAVLLGTVGRVPRPLPASISLAVAADGGVYNTNPAAGTMASYQNTITQNQSFAFFILKNPHISPESSFVIVVVRDRQAAAADMAGAVQEELARSWPERIEKILPDSSFATELVANPSLFPPNILPNGALYWKTEAGTIFLITDADYFVITNNSTVIFNQPVRRILQQFAKNRPRGCQVYLQASAKEQFPPKWLSVELPTTNGLLRLVTDHLKQKSVTTERDLVVPQTASRSRDGTNCVTWG